jgi:hypothetical protein
LRLLNKEYWLANDPWFTLCRDHVQKCILFLTAKHGIYAQVNEGGLANESIFAIILQTFKEITNPKRMINESATISDWSRMTSPTSPYTFIDGTEENVKFICDLLKKNKYALFLRKVNKKFPDTVLKEIMDMDFGHTYELLHNQATKRQKKTTIVFYSNTFLKCLFVSSFLFLIFLYYC